MRIFIDGRSATPIYDQIYTKIRALITAGELEQDHPLPSIRNLAKDLKISVVTTKRAYDELEKDGYIYTVAAKGCFVARIDRDKIKRRALSEIADLASRIAGIAGECGISEKEARQTIQQAWRDIEK